MPSAGQQQVRHWRFALYYLFGPDSVRGHWESCGQFTGFKETPSRRNKILLQVIEEVAQLRPRPAAVDLTDLSIPASDAPQDEWKLIAEKVKPILLQAAMGTVEIEAQQRLVIQEIINRAEGKAGSKQRDEGPQVVQPVILLPTIGGERGAVICESCQKKLQEVG